MFIKARTILSLVLVGVLGVLPGVDWNTFLGAPNTSYNDGYDEGSGIAIDGNGNTYVIGHSQYSWGTPLHAHAAGEYDAYIARLNSSGVRQWHTFLGGTEWDFGSDIALDNNGNIYVTGLSNGTWGTPVRPFGGGWDAFVAKFNGNGDLQWSTFLGAGGYDSGSDVVLDNDGNVYVTGTSNDWGTPINPHGGSAEDAFVAKINSSGVLQWHTFLGGEDLDGGFAIDVTPNGEIFVTGESDATWGTPIVAHHGNDDAFVAKINSTGALQWSTFLGGEHAERGAGIGVDGNGNIYVAGFSWWGWGAPINPHAGGITDAFVAKLNGNGVFQWHTFLGGTEDDMGNDLTVDGNGHIYVTGYSASTWGTPFNEFAGGDDAFVARLNGNGVRLWNTFLGGNGTDEGYGIAVDDEKFYATGYSGRTWGNPLVTFAGGTDAFVAQADSSLPIFSDVPGTYWARQYIERLFDAGVTGGCGTSPLRYCPETTVTRSQMAVFLLRGIHGSSYVPPAVGGSTGFGDVSPDYWAAAWIKQLAAEGITGGCGSGSYCPEYPVTRDQMAVFLLRSKYGASYTPPAVGVGTGFGDVPADHWAAPWIKQLAAEGITGGCSVTPSLYCPATPVSRAQMAVFLVKTFNLP